MLSGRPSVEDVLLVACELREMGQDLGIELGRMRSDETGEMRGLKRGARQYNKARTVRADTTNTWSILATVEDQGVKGVK